MSKPILDPQRQEEEAADVPHISPRVGRGDGGVDVEITAAQKMMSAMSGSFITSLLVTPLDVVRVRLQSQPQQATPLARSPSLTPYPQNLGVTACCREVFFSNSNMEACFVDVKPGAYSASAVTGIECAVEETQRRTFNSTLDGLQKIARNEGITTLWRGLSATLVMMIPSNVIYFTGYEWLRFNPQSPINKVASDAYAPLVAGSTARTMSALVVSPIEMLRTRMQASQSVDGKRHFVEALRGIKEMVERRGYTSLWRGLTLTLWRDVPFSGFYWWGYETVRGALTDMREQRRAGLDGESRARSRSKSQSRENSANTFTDSFIAGASSGAVASILTMPFDVGKTRQQVFKDAGNQTQLAPEQQSMPRFLLHIFRTEGLAGLWKGWIPRTLKVAPGCAIMISSYELGKKVARGVNQRAERTAY